MAAEAAEARILAACPELAGRIGTALQLAHAWKSGALAQVTPAAYLLPLGLRANQADAAAGLFRQGIDRLLGVVLVERAIADPLGSQVVDTLQPRIDAVIGAIAGWAPDDAIGVYKLERAELVSLDGGVASFQIDFSLDDQLRIVP